MVDARKIAYVLDPRFPGGTSSAVAAELGVMQELGQITVHAQSTRMFKGQQVAPQLQAALMALDIELIWDAKVITGDVVIFHNPSCLRFQDSLPVRIVTEHLIVVEHENFLQPGGQDAFDTAKCHAMLAQNSMALRRSIAPISAWNRDTITRWMAANGPMTGWTTLASDWFNICAFEMQPPTDAPRDRRGRHSRPGLEKFAPPRVLAKCFPKHAELNLILGADALMAEADPPSHWTLVPFRGLKVEDYLNRIDFLVYYTAPTFRESFGRVLAEGIAAGKIVITDPETAANFGSAAIGADPEEVDGIIEGYVAAPKRYASDVRLAQDALKGYSAASFLAQTGPVITGGAASQVAA
jgi:hypothetical protein